MLSKTTDGKNYDTWRDSCVTDVALTCHDTLTRPLGCVPVDPVVSSTSVSSRSFEYCGIQGEAYMDHKFSSTSHAASVLGLGNSEGASAQMPGSRVSLQKFPL